MARKVGQIIARGDRRWLIRVYLGRDRETNKWSRNIMVNLPAHGHAGLGEGGKAAAQDQKTC
jgi:hypothetical protein